MVGAAVCFHTASPFWMDGRVDNHEMVQTAEDGTLNVLRSCAAAAPSAGGELSRVVLTSSFAALMSTSVAADYTYTEADWNSSSAPDASGEFPEPQTAQAYRWSKTAAERSAWDFVEGTELELTTILPPMVLGENKNSIESLGELNQSSLLLHRLLSGEAKEIMPGSLGFTDVADVAKAHVLAASAPAAAGQRYLCSGTSASWVDVCSILRELFPERADRIPTDGPEAGLPCLTLDSSKIERELGMEFVPLRETLRTQGNALKAAGLL